MSDLFKQYVEGKTIAEISSGIVNAIRCGRISKTELLPLLDELEQDERLNDANVDIVPKTEWNEDYLQELRNEVVSGAFSRQYLLYLADVSDYVNGMKQKTEPEDERNHAGIIVVAIIFIFIMSILAYMRK